MYYLISIFAGISIAAMLVFNGQLTALYGSYYATVLIHIIGLICAILVLILKKHKLKLKKIPIHLYIGGCIGVGTTLFNNLAFGKISVTAIIALSLLGQTITSLIIDELGCFGMPKQKFYKEKMIGLLFVSAGIIFMLTKSEAFPLIPIILSMLSGTTVVLSRTVNASLAEKTDSLTSTFFNYAVGLLVSLVLFFIIDGAHLNTITFQLSSKFYIYLGGVIGVAVVFILNATVSKISSYFMTLLLFIGQIFAGILLDIIITKEFSTINFIGGIFVAVGLCSNIIADKKHH